MQCMVFIYTQYNKDSSSLLNCNKCICLETRGEMTSRLALELVDESMT